MILNPTALAAISPSPRRVLVGFASTCCPAPPQFWASFSCWPPSLLAIHSEQKRPLAVARDRSYFRSPSHRSGRQKEGKKPVRRSLPSLAAQHI
ncbi:hypothetical protein TNCV_1691421 [Trichonephila clavipes]|nr:hypothetical protein TNCV_1691421 [Trichonephila clavipes]